MVQRAEQQPHTADECVHLYLTLLDVSQEHWLGSQSVTIDFHHKYP